MSTELKLEIGEAQIQNAIAVALAESFSPERKDRLIKDIVRAHLNVKQNSYDRETLLNQQVGNTIREMARVEVGNLVETWRPKVNEIVAKALGPSFQDALFERLKDALQSIRVDTTSIRVQFDQD
jgi:hypothetical protein